MQKFDDSVRFIYLHFCEKMLTIYHSVFEEKMVRGGILIFYSGRERSILYLWVKHSEV